MHCTTIDSTMLETLTPKTMKIKQKAKLQRLIESSSQQEIQLTKLFLFNKLRVAISGLTEAQVAGCVPVAHKDIDLAEFPIEGLILFERNLQKLQASVKERKKVFHANESHYN